MISDYMIRASAESSQPHRLSILAISKGLKPACLPVGIVVDLCNQIFSTRLPPYI